MTWGMLFRHLDVTDAAAVAALAAEPVITVTTDANGQLVTVDEHDVTDAIRSAEVTSAVSAVSAVPDVRARLVALQREAVADALAAGSGIVVEGRDIGTVVLPDADLKVFLTADEAARASRRALEEAVRAGHPNPQQAADEAAAEVAELLAARDALDSGRAVSPLKPASDAVVLDASLLTLEDVVAHVVALVRERVGHV
jgi:cytidylate kinase